MPIIKDKLENPEAYTNNRHSFYLGLVLGSIIGASAMLSVCQLYDITRVKSQEHMTPNALEETIIDDAGTTSDTHSAPYEKNQPATPQHH